MAGDRTAALRQYDHCVTALNEELGVNPSRLTVNLYNQIRLDEPLNQSPATHRDNSNVLPGIADHLQHMRQALLRIREQVQKDIKAVEEALDEWK
jgi:DNA-binding SARP family transcriptional activator